MLPPLRSEAKSVSVGDASDDHFQEWIVSHKVPVEEDGIVEWSFDDRLDVICYALENGLPLTFVDEQNKPYQLVKINSETIPQTILNNSETELNEELFEATSTSKEAK